MSFAQQECQSVNWCQSLEASEFLFSQVGYARLQSSVKSIVHQGLQVHRRNLTRDLRLLQSTSGLLCIA